MAGSSTAEPTGPGAPDHPRFYFDLASPEAYLVAERVLHDLPELAEWIPVWTGGLAAAGLGGAGVDRAAIERTAAERGLLPVRWPAPFPADTRWAMLVATFAKQIGRTVPFAQAAFRQAFAGGRDLGQRDWVLIAASACEMHPTATVKSTSLGSIARRLDDATRAAADAGVLDVPAIVVGSSVFHGDAELEGAADALRARSRAA